MKNNYRIPIVFVFFLIVISCHKEYKPLPNDMNSSAETARQEFSKLNYQIKLKSILNDTADLEWEPAWTKSYEKKVDSVNYIYIPLVAKGIARETGQKFPIHTTNIAKLLLIKKSGSVNTYYIQTFISSDTDKEKIRNFTEKHLDFKRFSGSMYLENVSSDEFITYHLKAGTYEKNTSLKSNARMSRCTYETICDW